MPNLIESFHIKTLPPNNTPSEATSDIVDNKIKHNIKSLTRLMIQPRSHIIDVLLGTRNISYQYCTCIRLIATISQASFQLCLQFCVRISADLDLIIDNSYYSGSYCSNIS